MIYIALLRGINVGGHMVKMERLRELFKELGFTNVRSYIQSGNVFFETEETDRELLVARIEHHLYEALGFAVPVFLRTIPELEELGASDAFQHLTVTSDMRLCVVFTKSAIPETLALPLRSPKNDMEVISTTDHEAFMVWYIINGRPPVSYVFKELGTVTTTRFFHTLAKILQAARKA
ncbi:DUF1697 domain-containing protein [Ktedonosporobacter rubrisoli]|uniref:DUF1697 domain-containing protein n=1 Tax=Ktedonosporobacter rubrisoli TaxID=2509675 RepID=A0A4V0YYD3_KTERU|nr:DUF1697 domain-containing protein [Ktedonosporobacter rubrisoli]QBD75821.1 DUF1697 domain-containing protein [Ktedonosporobacter rubrisoli]